MTQKLLLQVGLAFVGAACVALAPLAGDGISQAEVFAAIGAGASAAIALLKRSPKEK